MPATLTELQQKLDSINSRGARLNDQYDNAPDGSDAKIRAQQELSNLSRERLAVEAEMDKAYDEMSL